MQPHLNQIHLGNCINVMQQLPSNSIDLILTDPPYLVNYRSRDGRTIEGDISDEWMIPAFEQMFRVLRHNSFAVSFYGYNSVDKFMKAWRKAGFSILGHFVFAKHYASRTAYTQAMHECAYLLAKGKPNMPKISLPDIMPWGRYTGNKLHPTQKPLEILRPLIKTYSHIGDRVLDPFAGSGSTLLAANQLHRSWTGIEMDSQYHRNAYRRIKPFSSFNEGKQIKY